MHRNEMNRIWLIDLLSEQYKYRIDAFIRISDYSDAIKKNLID